MSDLVTHPYALILDLLDDRADGWGSVEDWLLCSDPEQEQQAVVPVRADAHGSAISRSNTETSEHAPAFRAPNHQIELSPPAVVQYGLTSAVTTVRRAGQTLPSERPWAQTFSRIHLLQRLAVNSRSAQVERLTEAVQGGLTRMVLTDEQYRSYRWLAAAVLTEPVDRLVTSGSPAPTLDHRYGLEHRGGER